MLSKVSHPHIIKLYDSFADHNYIYILMQYAPKGDLHQVTLLTCSCSSGAGSRESATARKKCGGCPSSSSPLCSTSTPGASCIGT